MEALTHARWACWHAADADKGENNVCEMLFESYYTSHLAQPWLK